MGMGAAPAHGWVIEDEKLREIVPKEYDALIHLLEQVHQIGLGDLARDFQMEEAVDKEIGHAYADLVEAFEKATKVVKIVQSGHLITDIVPLGHLTINLGYYDQESGDRYDELETSHYWNVEGMTQLSPAGEKFKGVIEEKSWTVYG